MSKIRSQTKIINVYALVLLIVIFTLSISLTGCTGRNNHTTLPPDAHQNNVDATQHPLTYEEMRQQGWKAFDELSSSDQAFLKRVLGSKLSELKGKKLLIKKATRSTVVHPKIPAINLEPNELNPDTAPAKPDGYCYEGYHSHCEGVVFRVDCISDGNPFGYARQNHYYRYLASTDGYGAWDHKGHILSGWVADISEFYLSYCKLYASCP